MSNCTETFTLANGDTVSCNRKAAPKKSVLGHENVCFPCFEAWMMENDHNDHGHDEAVANCPECGTYDPRTKQGHTKTKGTKQVHRSHANCNHDKTPAARAKCRKARAAAADPAPEVNADAPEDDHFGDTPFDESDYDSEALSAFKALTDKQREQAREALRANGIEGGTVDSDARVVTLTLALVDRARAKKTTVAKLSKGDLKNVIAIEAL